MTKRLFFGLALIVFMATSAFAVDGEAWVTPAEDVVRFLQDPPETEGVNAGAVDLEGSQPAGTTYRIVFELFEPGSNEPDLTRTQSTFVPAGQTGTLTGTHEYQNKFDELGTYKFYGRLEYWDSLGFWLTIDTAYFEVTIIEEPNE